jgi:hypothetical protein
MHDEIFHSMLSPLTKDAITINYLLLVSATGVRTLYVLSSTKLV